MARISGIELPKNKRIETALTYIYGIGISSTRKILEATKVNPDTRVKDLTPEQVQSLQKEIQNTYTVEGELRRELQQDIKRLMDIGTYRGLRHKQRLPVRGQRTRTNARTRKGKRKTIGTVGGAKAGGKT